MAPVPHPVDLARGVDELPIETQLAREIRTLFELLIHELRQEQPRLHVHQSRRNDEEVCQFFRQDLVLLLADVGHELVRHFRERNLRNIKLLLLNELEQEIKRPLEFVDLIRYGHGDSLSPFLDENKHKKT